MSVHACHRYMVLEFLQGGELLRLMEEAEYGRLPIASCRFYAASVTAAFAYLHSLRIVNRDLKPENMMLDSCAAATAHTACPYHCTRAPLSPSCP